MDEVILGIAIGGTKCAVSVGRETDGEIEVLEKHGFETRRRCAEEVMADFFSVIDGLNYKIKSIGVIVGGPLDEKKGLILAPPNLHGWDYVEVNKQFSERYGVPCTLLNDANAGALAEYRYGAGKGSENMLFVTFGTGCGAGLILDGRLYLGANSMAGEIGHVRLSKTGGVGYGKRGSTEGYCSGGGMAQTGMAVAKKLFEAGKTCSFCSSPNDLPNITAKYIAQKAEEGCADAEEVFKITGKRLGEALAVLVDLFNPDAIVLGGIYARNEKRLYKYARPVLEREALSRSLSGCKIVPAALGEKIDEYASLSAALYKI